MSPRERAVAALRWLAGPRGLMVAAVFVLFVLMAWSFLAPTWGLPASRCGPGLCNVPITNSTNPGGSVTGSLFGGYAVLVVVIALVLASCMIGGVYLAKMEGGPRP